MISAEHVEIHLNNWGKYQRSGSINIGHKKVNTLYTIGLLKGTYKPSGEGRYNITDAECVDKALKDLRYRYPLYEKILNNHYYKRKRGKSAFTSLDLTASKYYRTKRKAVAWLQIHLASYLECL